MKKKGNHIDIHKHLTQTELLDYTNGVLGNDEMYRLELHLNECELCSDAIEGVSNINHPKNILDVINAEIRPSKKETFSPNYMAIAASITLIAVFGLSYWLITKPEIKETVAINLPNETSEESAIPLVNKGSDSVSTIESPNEEIALEEEGIEEDVEINIYNTQITGNEVKLEASSKQKSIVRQKEIEPAEPTLAAADEETTEFEEVISSTVDSGISLSETVQPVQGAARAAKKTSTTPQITLKDQKEPLPIGGMSAFKGYAEKNLIFPQQAIDNNVKGTVVLEVSINPNGSINNITVLKGVGYGCDAEAMRLISTGPLWTPKVLNGEAVIGSRQVKIKFKK